MAGSRRLIVESPAPKDQKPLGTYSRAKKLRELTGSKRLAALLARRGDVAGDVVGVEVSGQLRL